MKSSRSMLCFNPSPASPNMSFVHHSTMLNINLSAVTTHFPNKLIVNQVASTASSKSHTVRSQRVIVSPFSILV